MPTLILSTPGTRAALSSERIEVVSPDLDKGGDLPPRSIPLFDVDQVMVSESCHLSTPLIAELLRRSIPLLFLSFSDQILGVCHPPGIHSLLRKNQYLFSDDPQKVLALAAIFVEAKIANQRRVLQRLASNRPEVDLGNTMDYLNALVESSQRATSLDSLRGYEGSSAGRYFEIYGSFYPKNVPFERRSRRPPHNAPNAILSYAYTLLTGEAEIRLAAQGIDPAIGFLHEPTDRRASLALDLIEPFRAPLADAMAIDLISHQILQPDQHFETREGGVYLNGEGKRKFFTAYERRMEREFTSDQSGQRTTLRLEM